MVADSTNSVSCRFLISGRVQGVFFRESTRQRAIALGIDGRALNLPDGRVEVYARGKREDVDALQDWLEKGPPAARVLAVETHPTNCDIKSGFRTG